MGSIAVQKELSGSIGNMPLREISDRLFYQTARMWLQLLPLMNWPEEVDAFSNEIAALIQTMELNDLRSLHFVRRNRRPPGRLRSPAKGHPCPARTTRRHHCRNPA